jgi:hypothetical protein
MSNLGVLCFHDCRTAIHAENLLTRSALDARLAPVPARVTSLCGAVVVFPWKSTSSMQGVLGFLQQAGIECSAAHHLEACDLGEVTW